MEAHEAVQDLKQRVLRDETVTAEEYKKVLDALREDRISGGGKAPKAKGASQVKSIDPDDLF